MEAVIAASVLDQSMIGTSCVSETEPARPNIDLESAPVEKGIDSSMISLSSPPPLSPQQD